MRKQILFVGWLAMAALPAALADPSYIGAAKCKLCHKTEYASWETQKHAQAFEMLEEADRAKAECLTCHATGGSAEMPGVQCESCHGPGSDYKSLKVMKDPEAALAAGLIMPDAATCEGCHTGAPHDQKPFDYESAKAAGTHETKKKDG